MNGVGLIAIVAIAIGTNSSRDAAVPANECFEPHGSVTPATGSAATRFHFHGRCVPRDTDGYGVFLIRFFKKTNCEAVFFGEYRVHVNKRHVGHGWLVPDPAGGHCFQSSRTHKLTPGVYRIGVGFRTATFARVRIGAL